MCIFGKACRCLLVAMIAGNLGAQDSKVSLRTLQLGGDEMPESWVRVADEKEPAKLAWLTSQPTEPIQALHDGRLKLFRYTTNPEGEETVEIIAALKLPGTAKELLLLGFEKNGEAKYVLIEDRFLNAKFNDWLAINTSGNPVAIRAGDKGKSVRVDAGKSVIFQPGIEVGKGAKVLAQAYRKGETKTFLSSYWPAFPGQRTMIIFYDDGEKMRAKRIGDRLLPKKGD